MGIKDCSEDMKAAMDFQKSIGTTADYTILIIIIAFSVLLYLQAKKTRCLYWIPLFGLSFWVIQVVIFQIRWRIMDNAASSNNDMQWISERDGGAALIPAFTAMFSSVLLMTIFGIIYFVASKRRNAT